MTELATQDSGKGRRLSRVMKPLSISVPEPSKHTEPVRSRSSLFRAEAFVKLPYDNLEDAHKYYESSMATLTNIRLGALKQRYDNVLATRFPLKNRYTNIFPYLRTQPIALYTDKFMINSSTVSNESTDSSLASNGTFLDDSNSFTNMSSYRQSISYINDNEANTESKSPSAGTSILRTCGFPMVVPKQNQLGSPRQPEDMSLIPPTPCTAKALSPEEQETEQIYLRLSRTNLMIRYFNGNIVSLNNFTFLITQAPTIASMADFWYVVFRLKVVFIANLTRFIDDERPKAIRYWPLYKSKEHDPIYTDSVTGSYMHYAYQKAQDTNNPRAGQMFKQFIAYIKTVQEEIPEDSLFWNCTRMKLHINAVISEDAIAKSDAIGFSSEPIDAAEVEDDEGDDPLSTNLSGGNVNLLSSPLRAGSTKLASSEKGNSQPDGASRTTTINQQITLGCVAMKRYRDQFIGYKVGIKCSKEVHYSKLYYYGLWTDYSIPDNFEIIFLFSVEALRYKNRGPLCIHCSAGVGRSSTFAICIVITNMLINNFKPGQEFVKKEDVREGKVWRSFKPSILEMTEILRVQRNPLCVQTVDQFIFLHDYCNFAYAKLRGSFGTSE